MLSDLLFIVPGLAGAIFCACGSWTKANAIWSVGNIFLIMHNIDIGDMSQAVLFCVYEIIAVFGIVRWYYLRKTDEKEKYTEL